MHAIRRFIRRLFRVKPGEIIEFRHRGQRELRRVA